MEAEKMARLSGLGKQTSTSLFALAALPSSNGDRDLGLGRQAHANGPGGGEGVLPQADEPSAVRDLLLWPRL